MRNVRNYQVLTFNPRMHDLIKICRISNNSETILMNLNQLLFKDFPKDCPCVRKDLMKEISTTDFR